MAVTLSRLDHHGKLRWSNWLRYFGCWLISNSTQTSGNAGKDLGLFSSCYTPNSVGWSEDSLASMTQTIWFGVWVKNSCNYSAKHGYKITQPADVTSLLWVFFFCERHSLHLHFSYFVIWPSKLLLQPLPLPSAGCDALGRSCPKICLILECSYIPNMTNLKYTYQ